MELEGMGVHKTYQRVFCRNNGYFSFCMFSSSNFLCKHNEKIEKLPVHGQIL